MYVRNYFLSAIWIWLNFLNNIILLEKCKTASNWLQMCILWKFEWNLKQIWILEITRNVQCKTQIRIFLKAKLEILWALRSCSWKNVSRLWKFCRLPKNMQICKICPKWSTILCASIQNKTSTKRKIHITLSFQITK